MGNLVVIEGMDGAGTSTQIGMLERHLITRGLKVHRSAEPTNSAIGLEIRKMLASDIGNEQQLLTKLALAFAADRMHHIHYEITPKLKENDFVLLDRYVLSSFVYQGLHLPTNFVKEINKYAIKPNLTIILDTSPDVAHERLITRKSQSDFYENLKYLEKIRSRYLHFAKSDDPTMVLVDASGSIQQVQSHLIHVMTQTFFK